MARPHEGDEAGVKRLARYFRQYPTAVLKYEWQTRMQLTVSPIPIGADVKGLGGVRPAEF